MNFDLLPSLARLCLKALTNSHRYAPVLNTMGLPFIIIPFALVNPIATVATLAMAVTSAVVIARRRDQARQMNNQFIDYAQFTINHITNDLYGNAPPDYRGILDRLLGVLNEITARRHQGLGRDQLVAQLEAWINTVTGLVAELTAIIAGLPQDQQGGARALADEMAGWCRACRDEIIAFIRDNFFGPMFNL